MEQPSPQKAAQTRWIALLAITAIALYLCWAMLQPFVGVLITAVVLVIVFHPAHEWLVTKLRRPALAAAISTAAVIFIILVALAVVTVAVAKQLPAAVDMARPGV